MNWAEISLKTTTEGIEIVSGFLMARGVSSIMIEDAADFKNFLTDTTVYWDYVDDELMKMTECDTVIKFYLSSTPQDAETLNRIRAELPSLREDTDIDLGELSLTIGSREEEEWETAWKKYYHPIVISDRIAVVPEWEEFEAAPGQKVLRLDPGMAFGTGGHQTTRLCLGFLSEFLPENSRVLDMGCGSGILSIASLLLGAGSVTGVDIDQLAVKISRENADLNGVGQDNLTLYCGDVIKDNVLADRIGEQKYDVITANIVADVIIGMSPLFPRYLKKGGMLFVSGIISERAEEVLNVLRSAGFEVREVRDDNDWTAAMLTLN